MAWFVKALNKDEKGFTLIELIVVIAILGILAAIAVPRVTTSLNNAKNNADQSNLKIVQSAVDRYWADNNAYPSNSDLDPDNESSVLVPKYLDKIPRLNSGYFSIDSNSGIVSIVSQKPTE
ncbi:hypothetical protein Thexy_1158 [Thermoanaerobacterium xylanolyticum LX-11]|uniref:Uncharacterized protein n=1 Tax=Thermoanaerobacterium xylanolyticum (strain ATCC 49914 / DSM 7097 / LX-11) TaxID=858215 RepID=F6BL07_THEXL|nr:prepilin-type N-terminal cleavage/methylation domain-containing protein [Thermoanaerobacterium xylanolyticum]AEF17191.1 hypothetical protein Thexy_1158 [Thermoanaerobacterium xylanolyticum LX-11]